MPPAAERLTMAGRPPARRYLDDVAPLVEAVPPGCVLTYGDVAELTGWGAARAVGAVMSRHGHELPWWRVVRADGSLPAGLLPRARLHWAEEGTPLRPGGDAVDLERARWGADGVGPLV
jgi:alkylated DNA nucleotide flippase Atl1